MKLGAVVVHYRAWPQVAGTLGALLAGSRRPDGVVVVDNASGDGSPDAIRAAFPQLDVVEATSNRGCAAGMNAGAEQLLARGMDAVLLLTDDVLLAPPALAHLEERLSRAPAVGVVGPLLGWASRPEAVFSAGGYVEARTWDPLHHREPSRVADWSGIDPQAREWLDGACVLMRADVLRRAGPLDEGYFHYFDDVDYHLRVRSLGWEVECVPAALAWQEPGAIPPELWVGNRLRFLARHAPARVVGRELARQARYALVDLRRGRGDRGRARMTAALRSTCAMAGPLGLDRARMLSLRGCSLWSATGRRRLTPTAWCWEGSILPSPRTGGPRRRRWRPPWVGRGG